MKTKLITLLILTISMNVFGQKFSGKAIYHSHENSSMKISGIGEAEAKKMQEEFKKLNHKIYTLQFNNKESIFKQEKTLNQQSIKPGINISTGNSSDNKLYKNIADGVFIEKKNFMGKTFLIEDSLRNPNWILSVETKKIGDYTCYKATKSFESHYEKYDSKTDSYKDTSKIINTTAWFASEISVNNGPDKFWGLPGLILEVEQGKKKFVCSEISIEHDKDLEIEKPEKGKKVNATEFENIRDKKAKEMMKRFKNNRKSGNESGISITITK